jgi:Phage tail lysozyme
MPTIVDSLFLELGVDTSKFSKDQRAALDKIAQFESQTKRAAGNARGGIQTVGSAFRDLANDSRLGTTSASVENLAKRISALGVSMKSSGAGGMAEGLGGMAMGLGAMLSPVTLGIVTMAMLTKEAFSFNRSMTEINTTLARNAELSGTSATNLWAMGQAAKTVGGNAESVEASIAGLQTSLAGMSIGVGSAVPQLIGMARLRKFGAQYNPGGFGQGVDEESLFKAARAMYQSYGGAARPGARVKTMAFLTQYGLMGEDQANLAMSDTGWQDYKNAQAKAEGMKTGGGFEAVVRNSIKSQRGIGESDIAGSIAAEEAYGGIQQPMQTMVGLLTDIRMFISAILNGLSSVFNWASKPKQAYDDTVEGASRIVDDMADAGHAIMSRMLPNAMRSGMSRAMQTLMGAGVSKDDAAAMVGNMAQESSMNLFARNGSHVGLGQWNKARQADFEKRYHYQMGASDVPKSQQERDQTLFFLDELRTTQQKASSAMAKAHDLMGKTKAIMDLDEAPGDHSLDKRISNAVLASRAADVAGMVTAGAMSRSPAQHTVTSETSIGDVHLHTNATDPASHAAAFRDGISKQPLVDPSALVALSLSTRGMAL